MKCNASRSGQRWPSWTSRYVCIPESLRLVRLESSQATNFSRGARETAEHALRLMLSGLFDRYPNPRIVLGHCGEGLPTAIDRTDLRIRHFKKGEHGAHQRELAYYFAKNFWITMAGVQKASTLDSVIREVGIDRVMYSADYPYEDMIEAAQWFDGLELDDASRAKLAYGNAKVLLGIK